MSIYASTGGLDEEAPCGAPWLYRGSHLLPAVDDPRADGGISLAEIPSHITRDGRDDRPEDGAPWPWLRVSMDYPDALIGPAQARYLAAELTGWADRAERANSGTT